MAIRSRYEEDVYTNNHTSVWGSFWSNGQWGYKCCHSFVKVFFLHLCTLMNNILLVINNYYITYNIKLLMYGGYLFTVEVGVLCYVRRVIVQTLLSILM